MKREIYFVIIIGILVSILQGFYYSFEVIEPGEWLFIGLLFVEILLSGIFLVFIKNSEKYNKYFPKIIFWIFLSIIYFSILFLFKTGVYINGSRELLYFFLRDFFSFFSVVSIPVIILASTISGIVYAKMNSFGNNKNWKVGWTYFFSGTFSYIIFFIIQAIVFIPSGFIGSDIIIIFFGIPTSIVAGIINAIYGVVKKSKKI